jgi:hypothetical protein
MHGSAEKLWVFILFQNNLSLKTAVTKKKLEFSKNIKFFFPLNYFYIFLNSFILLMLKNIILIYFQIKNTLKNNYY